MDEVVQPEASDAAKPRRTADIGDDEFLVPGPTSTSNEGAWRWGLSWLIFSIVLMVLLGLMSFVCWWLATITGIA
jgi:hypothetical protein